jgi:hypothetical protein
VTIELQSQEQRTTYQQTIAQMSTRTLEEQQQNLYIVENQIVLQFKVQEEEIII